MVTLDKFAFMTACVQVANSVQSNSGMNMKKFKKRLLTITFAFVMFLYAKEFYQQFYEKPSHSKQHYGRHVSNRPSVCKPRTNIMFLKTHKTGSSTVQNVLRRYAVQHRLTVGLPIGNRPSFKYEFGSRFRKGLMQPVPVNRDVNMILHHMRLNAEELKSVMPNDTAYVTILREPASQFISGYEYYGRDIPTFHYLQLENKSVNDLFKNPEKYFYKVGYHWWAAKNNMFYDLGFNNTADDDEYIAKSIREIEKTFDLVLIAEYMDISMLLLADLMCWQLTDMVYLNMNKRLTPPTIARDLVKKIRLWNKADTAIYRYFSLIFWEKVEQYKKARLEKNLRTLKRLRKSTEQYCIRSTIPNSKNKEKIFQFASRHVELESYVLREETKRNATCVMLALPEDSFTDVVREMAESGS